MKILGYGDCCVDYYMHTGTAYPGGNALNVSMFSRENDADAAFLGTMGTDAIALHIAKTAKEKGLDISHCPVKEGNAGRAAVNIVDGNRVFDSKFFAGTHSISGQFPPMFSQADLEYIKGFDLVHGSCYAHIEEGFARLKDLGTLLSFDFSVEGKFRTDKYLEKVCDGLDLGLFSCEHLKDTEIEELVKRTKEYGCKYVLITMGPRGQRFYVEDRVYQGQAEIITPVDTMGAGDSFCAAFLVGLLKRGWKKNVVPTKEMIEPALKEAAHYSAKNCLVDGSFGCGLKISF